VGSCIEERKEKFIKRYCTIYLLIIYRTFLFVGNSLYSQAEESASLKVLDFIRGFNEKFEIKKKF